MSNLNDWRSNGRRRLEGRRRNPPWVGVLLLAMVMFLGSIGLTITVAFFLDQRITAIEQLLDIREK